MKLMTTVYEYSPSPFTVCTSDGQILMCNSAFCVLTGYPREELYGMKWAMNITPVEWHGIEAAKLEALRRTGYPQHYEKEYVHRDGYRIQVELLVCLLYDTEDNIEYYYTLINDISQRKQGEEKLNKAVAELGKRTLELEKSNEELQKEIIGRKKLEQTLKMSEVRLRRITDHMIDILCYCDANGILQYASPSHKNILGYEPENSCGNSIFNHVHPEDLPGVKKAAREAINNLSFGRIEYRVKHMDGHYVWLDTVGNIIIENDQLVGAVFVSRDITENKYLKEKHAELREKTVRLQRLASLSAMSGGLVHEITQPVNTIKVIADGLLYFYERDHFFQYDTLADKLEKIASEADRINDIINHIRSFAGLGDVPEPVPCNINNIVNAALKEFEPQLLAAGISVKTAIDDVLPRVRGNRTRLEQVVNNLLLNAIQAFDLVKNKDKKIYCAVLNARNKVVLEIHDNATGISDEIMEQIFEPFISNKYGIGTGLGLAIVQAIITSFNGSVKVCNNKNGGASFIVELPVWKDEPNLK